MSIIRYCQLTRNNTRWRRIKTTENKGNSTSLTAPVANQLEGMVPVSEYQYKMLPVLRNSTSQRLPVVTTSVYQLQGKLPVGWFYLCR